MYAVVRRYEMGAGSRGAAAVDVLAQRIDEGLAPAVSETPGFVAVYSFDTGGGVVTVVGIFEEQEGAEDFSRITKEFGKKNFACLLQGNPQTTAGTVLAHRQRRGALVGRFRGSRRVTEGLASS
jgi:hypothetical protein